MVFLSPVYIMAGLHLFVPRATQHKEHHLLGLPVLTFSQLCLFAGSVCVGAGQAKLVGFDGMGCSKENIARTDAKECVALINAPLTACCGGGLFFELL